MQKECRGHLESGRCTGAESVVRWHAICVWRQWKVQSPMTIQNILCPVDLSDLSRRALAYAAALCGSSTSRLRVLEVIEIALPPMPGRHWQGFCLTEEMRAECLDELDRFVAPLRWDGAAPEIRLVEGHVVAQVLAEAEAMPADLVVMGTHGRGGFERFVLGSVTEKVLHKARCPVLAVPAGDHHIPQRDPFGTVLCALDFSKASLAALEYAEALARRGGQVVLVHVVDWPFGDSHAGPMPPEIDELRRSLENSGAQQLHDAVSANARTRVRLEEVVATGKPHREILRRAREHSADLIVMGAHGRRGLDVGLLGSTTNHVIRDAPCPVLTVRASTT